MPEKNGIQFTVREWQILNLLTTEGLTTPAIAERLHMAEKTVYAHVSRMIAKVDAMRAAAGAAPGTTRRNHIILFALDGKKAA